MRVSRLLSRPLVLAAAMTLMSVAVAAAQPASPPCTPSLVEPMASPPTALDANDIENPGGRIPAVHEIIVAVDVAVERDGFAMWYLDSDREGLPVFLFSEDRNGAADALRVAFTDDLTFAVREVDRSLAELDSIKQAIIDGDPLGQEGITMVAVGFDIVENRIEVGVFDSVERAGELLEALYGNAVHVVQDRPGQFDADS